jgi:hypothetical protein
VENISRLLVMPLGGVLVAATFGVGQTEEMLFVALSSASVPASSQIFLLRR